MQFFFILFRKCNDTLKGMKKKIVLITIRLWIFFFLIFVNSMHKFLFNENLLFNDIGYCVF